MRSLPRYRGLALLASVSVVLLLAASSASAHDAPPHDDAVRVVASGPGLTVGSAVGPDGALYVTDASAGTLVRVDPRTGRSLVVADGLPVQGAPGVGGPMDVAFLDGTAYVLVTFVGPDVGGTGINGIYRIDGHGATPIADIGAFATANPPATDYVVPSGLQFAFIAYRGAFLVTDGHHNRVYRVTTSGEVSVAAAFADDVPTGITSRGRTVWMTFAGPVPHLPESGRVVRLDLASQSAVPIASGARLAVDVAVKGSDLYVLSQGQLPAGAEPGTPALPGTGALYRVAGDGTMRLVVDGLDRPTSLQIIGRTAYIVTLDGEIDAVSLARHGGSH
ncbi:hypothetical protein DDP54_08380 [Cellulomonas sp. WB94]|uniref:ScyD/ScyE family protein n=1 Tax=Cellulomonas sp. WB94 TaxID=2173174 RepID=UPI000D578FC4|nr:ScyD/ScyE family protein [Cellulomonas sp. WB94]PVU83016.1 hypothetical protein DDP54_08380 [Cellulomonas sp. WB94]